MARRGVHAGVGCEWRKVWGVGGRVTMREVAHWQPDEVCMYVWGQVLWVQG